MTADDQTTCGNGVNQSPQTITLTFSAPPANRCSGETIYPVIGPTSQGSRTYGKLTIKVVGASLRMSFAFDANSACATLRNYSEAWVGWSGVPIKDITKWPYRHRDSGNTDVFDIPLSDLGIAAQCNGCSPAPGTIRFAYMVKVKGCTGVPDALCSAYGADCSGNNLLYGANYKWCTFDVPGCDPNCKPPCFAGDPFYRPKLSGTEQVLGKPSGPSDGPLVVDPNSPITLSAIYHDEWPIETRSPWVAFYRIVDIYGQQVATGNATIGAAPPGSGTGFKENKYLSLVSVNLPAGLPAGTFQVILKIWDGDGRGKDYGIVTWTIPNPCN